ncbi:MAG TPA: type II toxin-antitoxin system VapC family toxin [Pyrinomonadaceae bacterium]|nr:type II toxin-antitoxin system VapC family toxin [Pyrinomonadaceae bacterium]
MIDSNVLLDLYDRSSKWHEWSASILSSVGDSAELVINPIIYAEASIRFETPAEFDEVFSPEDFVRRAIPFAAAFLAGKAHVEYRRRGGVRAATLPDFFIGAHAAISGYKILTRDPRRFRRYFPAVELIAP